MTLVLHIVTYGVVAHKKHTLSIPAQLRQARKSSEPPIVDSHVQTYHHIAQYIKYMILYPSYIQSKHISSFPRWDSSVHHHRTITCASTHAISNLLTKSEVQSCYDIITTPTALLVQDPDVNDTCRGSHAPKSGSNNACMSRNEEKGGVSEKWRRC